MPLLSSNNISSQPRRSKSFSSLRRHQLKHAKSFNTSELQHREALTAAEIAFERARERLATSNEVEHTPANQRTPNSPNFRASQLSRKQSIRFTGSNAVKTRELPYTRREVSYDQESCDFQEQAPRQEYFESTIGSEPSSYRKLRRAKSMFTPGKAPSDSSTNVMKPSRYGPFKRGSMRSSDSHHSLHRPSDHHLRRSFSFLRGMTDRISTGSPYSATDGAAVQMARDQYLRQLDDQRIQEQTSLKSCAPSGRPSKALPRTVRTSSNTSNLTIIQSPILSSDESKVKVLSRRARSVSQTLKKTLKKVFSRPLPAVMKLPEQHLSATKAHYGENWDQHYAPSLSPDVELLRRVDSRELILPELTSYYKGEKAQAESVRSLNLVYEDSNFQSRITSWTNSTAGNATETPQFVERKRLSVIKEDCDNYQPSSSTTRFIGQDDGYSAFRQPARLDHAGPAAAQRIYSALQREIHKGDQETSFDIDESEAGNAPSLSNCRQSRVTLVAPPSVHMPYEGSSATAAQSHNSSLAGTSHIAANPPTKTDGISEPVGQDTSWLLNHQYNYNEPVKRLTPQQIAHFNESLISSPEKPLREVKSAFFPSEFRIERRAISPYRRAMYDSSESTSDTHFSHGLIGPDDQLPQNLLSVRKSSAAQSESVYSRTEGRRSPRFIGSSLSLPETESSGEPGIAIINPSRAYLPGANVPLQAPWRNVSDQSSGEWKNWMASEVSHFENHAEQHDGIYNALPVKESGHKRENAQWDGEETVVGKTANSLDTIQQPLGMMQTEGNVRPALQESTARSNIARPSLQDRKIFGKEAPLQQKENNPNSGTQTPLDKHFTNMSGSKLLGLSDITFTGSDTEASRMPLDAYGKKENSPSSTNAQPNPERSARLHRLANKSSQSLSTTSVPLSPTNPVINEHQGEQPTHQDHTATHDWTEQSISDSRGQVLNKHGLVGDLFIRRRSHIRISDVGDPAFL